eukprot:Ihof_evm3s477 gene=Ihof_evmTU3s477
MPTLFIVDNTPDLFKPLDPIDANLRITSAQQGLQMIIRNYSTKYVHDVIGVITSSPQAVPVLNFTRDYALVSQTLLNLTPETTPLSSLAMAALAVKTLEGYIGDRVTCHIIWVTGRPELLANATHSILDNLLPSVTADTKVFIVAYHNIDQSHHVFCPPIKCPSEVTIYRVYGEDAQGKATLAYSQLAANCYRPCHVQLACGGLTGPVCLYPVPSAAVYSPTSGLVYVLPDILSVFGFINSKDISSFPIHSRHQVLASSLDEDNKKATCRLLLAESLRQSKMVALVTLKSDWHALLYSLNDPNMRKRTTLVLSILLPQTSIPWLGNLGDLTCRGINGGTNGKEIPLPNNLQPSYGIKNSNIYNKETLEGNFSRLSKYAAKLAQKPKDHRQLFTAVNKLNTLATIYQMDTLVKEMVRILETHM